VLSFLCGLFGVGNIYHKWPPATGDSSDVLHVHVPHGDCSTQCLAGCLAVSLRAGILQSSVWDHCVPGVIAHFLLVSPKPVCW
jgi:hypothetical protein